MVGVATEVRAQPAEAGSDLSITRSGNDLSESPLNFSFNTFDRTHTARDPRRAVDTALDEASSSLTASLGELKSELVGQLRSGAQGIEEGQTLSANGMARGANPYELGARQAISRGVSDNLVPDVAHRAWVRATAVAASASVEISGEANRQEQIRDQKQEEEGPQGGGNSVPGVKSEGASRPSEKNGAERNEVTGVNPADGVDKAPEPSAKTLAPDQLEGAGQKSEAVDNDSKIEPDNAKGQTNGQDIPLEHGSIESPLAGESFSNQADPRESSFGSAIRRIPSDSLRVLRADDAFARFDPDVTQSIAPERVVQAMNAEAGRIKRLNELGEELARRRNSIRIAA